MQIAPESLVLDEAVFVLDDPLPAPEPIGEPGVFRTIYLRVVELVPPDDLPHIDDWIFTYDVPLDVAEDLEPTGHHRRSGRTPAILFSESPSFETTDSQRYINPPHSP